MGFPVTMNQLVIFRILLFRYIILNRSLFVRLNLKFPIPSWKDFKSKSRYVFML